MFKNANKSRMDVAQVANRLNVSRSTVYRLIRAGELKAAAFGLVRGLQVFEDSVEDYEHRKMEEAKVGT
jgi:excisionase family DNA binding protein